MKILKYFLTIFVGVIFFSCSLFEPEIENLNDKERVLREPAWAEGLMLRGYSALPYNTDAPLRWDEVATDDAVSNLPTNSYRNMATGSWTSINNPHNVWNTCLMAIMNINEFFSIVDGYVFRNDERNELIKRRFTGEAYALRGALKYYLLRNHGGIGTNGELLGFPIFNEFLDINADFGKPRDKFDACVESAYADFAKAIALLPLDLGNVSVLPDNFKDQGYNIVYYNDVFGDRLLQRMSGRIAKAFRVRLALLHASPAFNINNDVALWRKAAEYADDLLSNIELGMGGIGQLDPYGDMFYQKTQANFCDLGGTPFEPEKGKGFYRPDIKEHLWRRVRENTYSLEQDYFPPGGLNGRGRINPTQNFVDAFPMADGYPIGESPNFSYDKDNPYANRDPRLDKYVVYNGAIYCGYIIYTGVGGSFDENRLNATQTSTRTGYYLKKLLREDVTVGTTNNSQIHIHPFIRYTEMFLALAEALNEGWGPSVDPFDRGYNAKDIVKAIRYRAGIRIAGAPTGTNPPALTTTNYPRYLAHEHFVPDDANDPYVAGLNQAGMRALIQNERRLELSFESHRFWDIRRWKLPLNVAAKGVRIDNNIHTLFDVEPRQYQEHMCYGPIPNGEVVKFNYVQNRNW